MNWYPRMPYYGSQVYNMVNSLNRKKKSNIHTCTHKWTQVSICYACCRIVLYLSVSNYVKKNQL